MTEPLSLNNDPINRHAKLLLTRIDPWRRFHIRDMNHVPQSQGDRPPKLYFLSLLEWFVEEHNIKIANTKKQQTEDQVFSLLQMPASEAWKWLGIEDGIDPNFHLLLFHSTGDPIQGARLALETLHFQMFGEREEIFEFKGDAEDSDDFAVEIAMKIARRLVQDPKVTPQQIVGLGHALYALERLPAVTPGAFVGYGVTRHWEGHFSDMYYVEFRISTEEFEIKHGGSKDSGVGHDSYSDPGWYFDVHGNRYAGCNLCDLEYEVINLLESGEVINLLESGEVINLLESGAEIRVDDESDIDFIELES